MSQSQPTTDKPKRMRILLPLVSGVLVVAALAGALVFSINAKNGAHAAAANATVAYADSTWNCTTYTCSSRVAAGSSQPNEQCAEFVARSLAASGKIPGLSTNSSQSAYGSYHAKNGKTYDLLWVGVDSAGYNDEGIPGLYQYLIDNKVGSNIGNAPTKASPGDVTFYFEGQGHTGVLVQAGSNALIDAHNNARYHVGYTEGYSTAIVHIGGKVTPPPPTCPAEIQEGSTGSAVGTLQSTLNSLRKAGKFSGSPYAYTNPLAVDKDFGPQTRAAVMDFQTAKKIGVDGIVGPQTWHALGKC